jgi:hypothetical protein
MKANDIKKELKLLGFDTKNISVKIDRGCYDYCIEIKIKAPNINAEEIENALDKYSQIRYCEASGEILAGGNTFVFVSYDWNICKEYREQFYQEFLQYLNTHNITKQELEPYAWNSIIHHFYNWVDGKIAFPVDFIKASLGSPSYTDKEIIDLINKENDLLTKLVYQLNNHEYCYTGDVTSALKALGLTIETVDNNILKKAVQLSYQEN